MSGGRATAASFGLLVALAASAGCAGEPESIAAEARRLADEAAARGRIAVAGSDGFLFFAGDLRHLSRGRFWGPEAAKASAATAAEAADPLPVISDFAAALKARGIELVLVPVPGKAVVYADKLFSSLAGKAAPPARVDPVDQEFYRLLGERGVTVLDLTAEFLEARKEDAGAGPLFCRQDTHWSGRGIALAAAAVARAVTDRAWRKELSARRYETETRDVAVAGDLAQDRKDLALAPEKLRLRFVGTRSGTTLVPVPADRSSPVALLGDSHTLVFDDPALHATGAGLASALALTLGVPIDQVGSRGSGGTSSRMNFLRRAKDDPRYLDGKKLVVWCFAAREWTESSAWRKLTLSPAAR